MVLLHVAITATQLSVPRVHSLTSLIRKKKKRNINKSNQNKKSESRKVEENIPVQVTPVPEYPALQAQVNDPIVLLHVAVPFAQWSVPKVHSLTSEIKMTHSHWTRQTNLTHKETKHTSADESSAVVSGDARAGVRSDGVGAVRDPSCACGSSKCALIDILKKKNKTNGNEVSRWPIQQGETEEKGNTCTICAVARIPCFASANKWSNGVIASRGVKGAVLSSQKALIDV